MYVQSWTWILLIRLLFIRRLRTAPGDEWTASVFTVFFTSFGTNFTCNWYVKPFSNRSLAARQGLQVKSYTCKPNLEAYLRRPATRGIHKNHFDFYKASPFRTIPASGFFSRFLRQSLKHGIKRGVARVSYIPIVPFKTMKRITRFYPFGSTWFNSSSFMSSNCVWLRLIAFWLRIFAFPFIFGVVRYSFFEFFPVLPENSVFGKAPTGGR